jgi:hypothetical protein
MKEIDFLPEWYKNSRRQQIGYQTQYIILGILLVAMVLWNFGAVHSISKAQAMLARTTPQQAEAEKNVQVFEKIKSEVSQLQKQADILEEINPRINVANVLGEISFVVDKRISLGKLQLVAEKFGNKKGDRSGLLVSDVTAGGGAGNKNAMAFGDTRFKVVISGVAADAGDVAKLISRLEDSPYFQQVYPLFSKAKKVKVKNESSEQEYQLNEFEISCYLENYREQ